MFWACLLIAKQQTRKLSRSLDQYRNAAILIIIQLRRDFPKQKNQYVTTFQSPLFGFYSGMNFLSLKKAFFVFVFVWFLVLGFFLTNWFFFGIAEAFQPSARSKGKVAKKRKYEKILETLIDASSLPKSGRLLKYKIPGYVQTVYA